MNLGLAVTVAVIFGAGVYLLLERDLVRVVAGVVLLSNAVNLFIIACGLSRGAAPIMPLPPGAPVSDPVVQALALTAIVISFGVTALILALLYRVHATNGTLDQQRLREIEEQEEERRQRDIGEEGQQEEDEPQSGEERAP